MAAAMRRPALSFVNGGLLGLLYALSATAFFGGWVALGSVTAEPLAPGAIDARALFVAEPLRLWVLTLVVAALGGLIVTAAAYGVGRALAPESRHFSLRYLVLVGTGLAAVLGFASVKLGITLAGGATADSVTVPVGAFVVTVLVAGAVAGGLTGPVVDALSRPDVVGEANEAALGSGRAVVVDMAAAVGAPLLAVVAAVAVVGGLAAILLGSPSNVVAIGVFAGVAAVVLAITAVTASRGGRRP